MYSRTCFYQHVNQTWAVRAENCLRLWAFTKGTRAEAQLTETIHKQNRPAPKTCSELLTSSLLPYKLLLLGEVLWDQLIKEKRLISFILGDDWLDRL